MRADDLYDLTLEGSSPKILPDDVKARQALVPKFLGCRQPLPNRVTSELPVTRSAPPRTYPDVRQALFRFANNALAWSQAVSGTSI